MLTIKTFKEGHEILKEVKTLMSLVKGPWQETAVLWRGRNEWDMIITREKEL